ncbi:hypothetical protein ABIC01_005703 [Bradyrhizobium sp. RT4b]
MQWMLVRDRKCRYALNLNHARKTAPNYFDLVLNPDGIDSPNTEIS